MAYDYKRERADLFTESGVETLTKVRDNVKRLIKEAGAVRSGEAMRTVCGSTWTMLAAFDYLVEKGELHELTGPDVAGQHRVFVGRS